MVMSLVGSPGWDVIPRDLLGHLLDAGHDLILRNENAVDVAVHHAHVIRRQKANEPRIRSLIAAVRNEHGRMEDALMRTFSRLGRT